MITKILEIEGHKMSKADTFFFTNSQDLKNASHRLECPKDEADGIFIPEQTDENGKELGPGWWPKNNISNWNKL